MTRNEEALMTMVSSTIVEFHNEYAAQPVKKFQDKATAVRRTAAVLDEAGMEFDDSCQLRPKVAVEEPTPPKLNFNDDKQHEIDSMHMADQNEEEPIKQRASADRQPTLKGQRLAVVGGKDAANPFREGSKSHAAFAYLQANPGSTYEELKAAGVRMRAITHSKKEGWIRTL